MICAANRPVRRQPLTARRLKQALAETLRAFADPVRRRLARAA
jgi:hypothetical protein